MEEIQNLINYEKELIQQRREVREQLKDRLDLARKTKSKEASEKWFRKHQLDPDHYEVPHFYITRTKHKKPIEMEIEVFVNGVNYSVEIEEHEVKRQKQVPMLDAFIQAVLRNKQQAYEALIGLIWELNGIRMMIHNIIKNNIVKHCNASIK